MKRSKKPTKPTGEKRIEAMFAKYDNQHMLAADAFRQEDASTAKGGEPLRIGDLVWFNNPFFGSGFVIALARDWLLVMLRHAASGATLDGRCYGVGDIVPVRCLEVAVEPLGARMYSMMQTLEKLGMAEMELLYHNSRK